MYDIEGMKKGEAMETLIREGLSFAEAETYWKENGSKASRGFTGDFLVELEREAMDDALFELLIGSQSKNIQNHRKLYDNIRSMANAIWAAK